ncbi:response regulator transcription factor [Salinisphaera orenii]|uniref:LuxR family transcriptional regulator n=1 Tax=Salinisphaera orenii YIM 95161 TaxID=1051139 RepID=A0A423PV86_9GAMM|nr:response regulator [Salinisphaera halophila]ROO29442.1 LuxR family transcriptional regulator [Salinisphaera halophila YIM 95161]
MSSRTSVHIVDDDASVRESLKSLMSKSGFDVHCYSSADAFLAHSAEVDGCALVDLRLQGMSGLELQRELIARRVPVSVIMMSAYGDVEHAVSAMRLGAVDFVEKPFDPQLLLQKVSTLTDADADAERGQRDARQHASLIDTLTPREKQVLQMIVDGLANKQVAGRLGISARTVETHRVHIMQKLGAESLPHLVRIWLTAGHYVEMPETPS